MRILVAVDGSPSADRAVELIATSPWPAGSSVRAIEVIETGPGLFGGPWPAIAMAQAATLEEDLVKDAHDVVARARDRLATAGLEASGAVLRGRPALSIDEAAEQMAADLIVVGSRGHGVIESMLLGSSSAEVVDHASIPILVARGQTLERVVLAWDGSDCARMATDLVRRWPAFSTSWIHVVTVTDVEVPWWTGFPAAGSPEMLPMFVEAVEESRSHHRTLARDLAAQLQSAGLKADADPREGDAATELLAAAREATADLIVLGTHGRTGLSRLVIGSVARNVLQHAHCSVLIVPERARRG